MGGLLAGIEAGGTKFVLGLGASPEALTARHVIATRDPETTMDEAARWFSSQGGIRALGIGSFGPVERDPTRPEWGHILNTPKPGWTGFDIAGWCAGRLDVPIGFDTDVTAAALAEYRYGAGRGKTSLAYVTIGTGIGGSIVVDGKPLAGAGHLEMGHYYPRRADDQGTFEGVCPYHGDCLEGLVSGPAIERRWGASLSELPPGHEAHGVTAAYLAQLCHAIAAFGAPEVIVLGGGVMKTPGLLDRVRQASEQIEGGYFPGRERRSIVAPALGEDAGIVGAMILAQRALERR